MFVLLRGGGFGEGGGVMEFFDAHNHLHDARLDAVREDALVQLQSTADRSTDAGAAGAATFTAAPGEAPRSCARIVASCIFQKCAPSP